MHALYKIAPTLPSVVGVSVTPTVQDNTPSLSVTWTAVNDPSVSYSVVYSTTGGSVPPDGAMMSGPTNQPSLTLTGLSPGTTYHIWVAADANGLTRSYRAAEMATTFGGETLINQVHKGAVHANYNECSGNSVVTRSINCTSGLCTVTQTSFHYCCTHMHDNAILHAAA